jgi:hypothetical protein
MKADAKEFLDSWKVRSLVSRYSEHIGFPIRMLKEGEGKPTAEWETVNSASALWTRPKNELKDEDYQNFYKSLSHDFSDALSWTHNRVEGNQNFTSLLFVPAKAPFDFMQGREERKGLKLYIRRVFIMDASEVVAGYRFVRGVVDSMTCRSMSVARSCSRTARLSASRVPAPSACLICSTSWPRTRPTNTRHSGMRSVACSRKASPRMLAIASASPNCCVLPRRIEGTAPTFR